jgi:hypothetical protein
VTAFLSLFRHLVTFLAGLGAMLAAYGVMVPADAGAAGAANGALADPAAVALGAVAAAVARLVMIWISGFVRGDKRGGGGLAGLLLCGTTAGFVGFFLPSCSPTPAGIPPVRAGYFDEGREVSYDTLEGITLRVDRRARK